MGAPAVITLPRYVVQPSFCAFATIRKKDLLFALFIWYSGIGSPVFPKALGPPGQPSRLQLFLEGFETSLIAAFGVGTRPSTIQRRVRGHHCSSRLVQTSP